MVKLSAGEMSRKWLPHKRWKQFSEWRSAAEKNGDAPEKFSDEERDRFNAHIAAIEAPSITPPSVRSASMHVFPPLLETFCAVGDIDPFLVQAIFVIESGGNFLSSETGLPVARFEIAQWWKRLNDEQRVKAGSLFRGGDTWRGDDDEFWYDEMWQRFHGKQEMTRNAIEAASKIALPDSAYECTSFGVAQIMGWHFKRLGYDSALTMAQKFSESVDSQIIGFFDFIRTGKNMLNSLRQGSVLEFAREYNGPGQAEFYANKMNSTYHRLKRST